MDALELLRTLTAIPAPPGQEGALAAEIERLVCDIGHGAERDAKGNVIVRLGRSKPRIVVTAHMDEIAMVVRRIEPDGSLTVTNMGGLYPWKLGEGPDSSPIPPQCVNCNEHVRYWGKEFRIQSFVSLH